ncbi:hypothetical protein IWW34DRAFT_759628, partial [Fusarium oxysporum f. sp. albedinis]
MSDPYYSAILIANHQLSHKWNNEAKSAIIGTRIAGISQRAVARVLGTEHRTIADI